MSVASFWSEARWGRAYGYRPGPKESNPYTLGYHIGQDVLGAAWTGPVPVLRAGRVAGSGRATKIGLAPQAGDMVERGRRSPAPGAVDESEGGQRLHGLRVGRPALPFRELVTRGRCTQRDPRMR